MKLTSDGVQLASDGIAEPPCHSRPEAEWCDKYGSGGFMGHTCWGEVRANSQEEQVKGVVVKSGKTSVTPRQHRFQSGPKAPSEQPVEEKVERVFIPKTSVLLIEDLFSSLLKHYTCGSLLTILVGLQEERGNQDAAHALLRTLEVRRGTVYVEGEPGGTPTEFVDFGAEGWVVTNHQDVHAAEVTQVSEEEATGKGAVLRDGESVRIPTRYSVHL